MGKHYFTFGGYPEAVQIIHANDPEQARNRMFAGYGNQWGFQYTEGEWQESLAKGRFKNAEYLPEIYCKGVK